MFGDDGFQDLRFDEFEFNDESDKSNVVNENENNIKQDIVIKNKKSIKYMNHRNQISCKMGLLLTALRDTGLADLKCKIVFPYLALLLTGKRNMKKQSVQENQLTTSELSDYKYIKEQLENKVRRKRVVDFINSRDITKRLINFFVVHYIRIHKEVAYFLDKTTYPYRIVGEFNQPFQSYILSLKQAGNDIRWINLHQQYKMSKTKNGKSNLISPYARSVSVKDESGFEYSLCEMGFYLWLDESGGFDVFAHFEQDVRAKKKIYDVQIREQKLSGSKIKKRKMLNECDGRNYKTYITPVSFSQPRLKEQDLY